MFHLSPRIKGNRVVVSLLTLSLCVAALIANAGAQEAPRDSGSLIKPPTIKPPTARSQNSNSRIGTSRRRKRRVRRARSRAAAAAAATKATEIRTAVKPREVQGVIVDSADSMPGSATEPSPPTTPLKPRGPISGGVLNARAIEMPLPPYPPIAKAARASGNVVVQVLIDENGNVLEAHAVSGHPLLKRAAEDAARNARFVPTRLSGQPVKVTGVITYDFVPQ